MNLRHAMSTCALLLAVTTSAVAADTESTTPPVEDQSTADAAVDHWRQWGGPGGDFQLAARPLAQTWGDDGPPTAWSRPLGKGYSAIAADSGVLYTMYRVENDEIASALDATTGKTIWEHKYSAPTVEKHVVQFGKGPNASPLVLPDSIITLGYTGILHALDRKDGKALWTHDLVKEFGGEVLVFGSSASPILHNDQVIVLVGGEKAGVMAFAPATGEVTWRSKPTGVSYSAPLVINVDGQEQIIYFSGDAINGLDAGSGDWLWSHPAKNQYSNNCSNPIWGDDNLLWVATQLDGGTRVLHLTRSEEKTKVEEVWFESAVNLHWWNTVRIGQKVYGSIGGQGSVLAAVDVKTGNIDWRERGFDKVKPIQVGELTILLDADGDLSLARLTPDGIEVLTQARIFASDESWTIPTLVGTTLYARDQDQIMALELGPKK